MGGLPDNARPDVSRTVEEAGPGAEQLDPRSPGQRTETQPDFESVSSPSPVGVVGGIVTQNWM